MNVVETEHKHRWKIESPNGPISQGNCVCGAIRLFKNVLDWDRDFVFGSEKRVGW